MNERITTAAVIIEDGKLLIAKRNTGDGTKDLWELPGGKNRYGESVEDTLKREMEEEFSLSCSVGPLIAEHDFINKDTLYHLKAHRVELDIADAKLVVHSEYRFVLKDELASYPMVPSDKAILPEIYKLL